MLLRRYPLVVAAVAVGLVGLVLLLTPASWLVGWILSIFALVVAAREGFTMVRRLLNLPGLPGTDAADALGMAITHAHAGAAMARLGEAATLNRRQHAMYKGGRSY